MDTKHLMSAAVAKADGEAGRIEAVFSTFDIIDSAGDIVVKDAFTDGQEVPLVWAHDWTNPIGKGRIRVEEERAVFDGAFWLDTADGEQAYRKVKNMGGTQEFSWGFRVLDAHMEERDAETVRVITKAEVFEVSPVLVGANRETYTLAIKSLGEETTLPLDEHAAAVLAANARLATRLRSHADLKQQPSATQKAGRVLSEANRERIKRHADSIRSVADDLAGLYDATAPRAEDDGKAATLAVVIAAQKTLARLEGVAV